MPPTYFPSSLEAWISEKFQVNDILHPEDLVPKNIARVFGIEYSCWHGSPFSYRVSEDSTPYIVENDQAAEYEQRGHFFHELGHILRHCGDQCNMPESFRNMQESEACLFAMYAAIPFHMLDFSEPMTIKSIMQEFHVTQQLAYNRIENIRQRIIQQQDNQRFEMWIKLQDKSSRN